LKNIIHSILVLIGIGSVSAQSTRFISSLDSSYVPNNTYLNQYSLEEYYASGVGDVKIEFGEMESELLNAAVFFALNKTRDDRRKHLLTYEAQLDYLAYNCVHYFGKSKFRYSKKNDLLFEKNLYLAAREMTTQCHLFKANACIIPIMNKEPKRKIHRNLKDSCSDYRLYYRNPPELKDELEDVVHVLTYNEFAQSVVEDINFRKIRKRLHSKSYETMACYVYIEPRSILSTKPPYAKVIQIIGARRLVLD